MLTELTKIHRRQQLLRDAMKALATATQASIDALDLLVGDPDLEESEADESEDSDRGDPAWVEWTSMRGQQKGGPNIASEHEDDEDADPAEDDDPAEDNADREAIDEREPDHDAEVETWAHWMDHPAELHVGQRPGHTTDQDVR